MRACSSSGRALHSHCRGKGFDSPQVHNYMYPDSSEGLNMETAEEVYFFTPAFHPLDNFSAHAIRIWDLVFPTLEHAFLWKKFADVEPEVAALILSAPSPHAAKIISDANRPKVSAGWYNERVSIMETLLRAKAEQHEDFCEALRRTGKRTIIENSPVDNFWGIGPEKKGENMLGKLLMKIRDELTS